MRFVERIQSRKFFLALCACLFFALTGAPKEAFPAITQVVLGYLAVQAAQDAVSDWQAARAVQSIPDGALPEAPAPESGD